jgi:hypothetical protein
MAANQVFSIPELLEMILKDLPFKDVLRSTRVNKTFQNTAKVFPRLRRKLFIQQDSDETDELSVEMEKASGWRWFDHSCSDDESEYDVPIHGADLVLHGPLRSMPEYQHSIRCSSTYSRPSLTKHGSD